KFDDSDLIGGSLPKGGGDGSGSNGKIVGWFTLRQYKFDILSILKNVYKPCLFVCLFLLAGSQGAIAGIVSAVLATVVGAVSSFIAYQKKKLCFKQSGKNS
ncbi:C99L2 protein, partial [Eurystomus gularis]|nr:C99L2 protein [Eurystomus gularis]